ncbi:hypothetical protein [Sinosporangium siamense]|uniref:Uncharacterized protein n=1 Tax=Sinosporangium siamense TaxID=1367973 RepID=A0A919RF60_9ACTN|nr:hypothetical protein [Sinosporangium siamense]GII92587.1 hypothetical protein Ssi02_28180 [Sinosporangium siamense]
MLRSLLLGLVPPRFRRAVVARLDARYVTKADHRDDIKDSLWEIQVVSREVAALRRDVERLRAQLAAAVPSPELAGRVAEVDRLAKETAVALDRVLQNEVLLWQAVDALAEGGDARGDDGAPELGGEGSARCV